MIIQPRNTKIYCNFNKNKSSASTTHLFNTSSTTYSSGLVGGGIIIDNVGAYVSPTNFMDDLVAQRYLTIFFRFVLTSFSTNAAPPNDIRPVIICYGGLVSGGFYIQIMSNTETYLLIDSAIELSAYYIPIKVQLNVEYSIAITYNNGTIRVYINGLRTNTISKSLQTQSMGLNFMFPDIVVNSGYRLGELFVGGSLNDYDIKRLHLGLHPLNK